MADRYLDNFTPGSNTSAYTSWATAATTLAAIDAVDTAGDIIYADSRHSESTAGVVTVNLAGTLASPTWLLSVTNAAPPTTLTAGCTIATSLANTITLNGSAYVYGITFAAGSGNNTAYMILASSDNTHQHLKSCTLSLVNTHVNSRIRYGVNSTLTEATLVLEDCSLIFANTSQGIMAQVGKLTMNGGSIGGSAITNLFASAPTTMVDATLSGVDLSAGATTMSIVASGAPAVGRILLRNCKLPDSWTGSLFGGAPANLGLRAEMHNCDSADTNYRLWVEDYAGSIKSESTIVRSSGASDGTTALSWIMVSSANAEYPMLTLATPEIVKWNDTTGSAITATVEIVTDNVTLTDGECWLEVQYLGTSGYPLGSFVSDAKADVLATAANQATSTETWTTTGLGTPVKQNLSVTFTPQEKGFIHAVVKLAKASTTIYVDPLLTVT